MGISSVGVITTVPRCYTQNGAAVVIAVNTVLVTPWYPEGVYQPSPAEGQANWAKSLAQNISPLQQPGLL